MAPTNPDTEFRNFVRTGDPQAIAAVFDALASDLLIVAAHLARSGTEAEDLVQSTFLKAIEERERFDTSRPVKPWLIGILANRARTSNRSARRRPDELRLHVARSEDPADAVDAEELAGIVAATIEQQPKHYRQVLHLRLVHDFQLNQIANALEIPLATVKSRLHRGLDKLRSALPTGVGVAGALAMSTDRLAAMREAVLDSASAVAPAVVGGAGLGTKIALTVALIPLLFVSAIYAWAEDGGTPTPPPASSAAVAQAVRADADVAEEPGTAPSVETLTPAAQRTSVRETPDPVEGGWVVLGTCVDDATGAPLPAKVSVFASARRGIGRRLTPNPARERLVVAATAGADGGFSLRLHERGGQSLRLLVEADGYAKRSRPVFRGPSGEMDVGELRLQLGTGVRLNVLDERGEPVAGARMVFCAPRDWHRLAGARNGYVVITSEAGIAVEQLPPGEFELHCDDDHELVEPVTITIDDRAPRAVIARVARPNVVVVNGKVVDDAGQPLAGIEVSVPREGKSVTTGADGSFRLAPRRGRAQTVVMAEDPRRAHADGHAVVALSAPEPVVITMRRYRGMACTVTRADTGAAVERFAIYGFGPDDGTIQRHENGRVEFRRSREHAELSIVPEDADLVGTGVVSLSANDAEEHRVLVYPRIDWRVRVVDDEQRPVANSVVELLHHHDPEVSVFARPARRVVMSRTKEQLFRRVRKERANAELDQGSKGLLLLARAATDAEGYAVLSAGRGQPKLTLRVTGQHVTRVLDDVAISSDEVEVRVASGGVVRGSFDRQQFQRILPDAWMLASNRRLRAAGRSNDPPPGVFFTGGTDRYPAGDDRVPVDDEGRFVFEGLPTGTWTMHLWMPASPSVPPEFGWTAPVATIKDLQVGEDRSLELRLDEVVGTVDAAVVFDGKPFANRKLWLSIPPDGDSGFFHHGRNVITDDAGRFVAEGLPVGVYRLRLSYKLATEGRHGSLRLPERIVVLPGQRTTLSLSSPRRIARVRLLDTGGEPVADRWFRIRMGQTILGIPDACTDKDGWFVVDPVPYGPFELISQGLEQAFEVEMPSHEQRAEWTLRLK